MTDRLISADALKREMWRRCGETDIETDKGRAKWDSGLWIRYKVFEECIADAPAIKAYTIEDLRDAYRDGQDNECSYHWGVRKAEPWYMKDEVKE